MVWLIRYPCLRGSMFFRPNAKITTIDEVDRYISRFQNCSKNGRHGEYRIVESKSGCWEWIAAKSTTAKEIAKRKVSYGRMALDEALAEHFGIEGRSGRHIRPHVLMYHCYVEDLNDRWDQIAKNGIEVAHRCGNSLCCRPDHLYIADREQNALDRVNHRNRKDDELRKKLVELEWWRHEGRRLGIHYPRED